MQFINNPFPFFLNDVRKNLMLILLTSIFVWLFLSVYTPYESKVNTFTSNFYWGIFCFITLYLNIITLPKLFPSLFDQTQWTVLKYLLFILWLFAFMSLLFSIINISLFCEDMYFGDVLVKTSKEVALTGIIPLLMVTVFSKNELLRQNLADAVAANKKIHEIADIKEKTKLEDIGITLSTDTSEVFRLRLTDLVYVAAVDNYSEVYWNDGSKVSVKLLRVTLKNVETQLSNQFITRCHRSYLINIREIECISGNTNGYKLKMKNSEAEIPVSRAKGKEIIAHIQQIRDLLDFIG